MSSAKPPDELAMSTEVYRVSKDLKIKHPAMDQVVKISIVYFRAGYTLLFNCNSLGVRRSNKTGSPP